MNYPRCHSIEFNKHLRDMPTLVMRVYITSIISSRPRFHVAFGNGFNMMSRLLQPLFSSGIIIVSLQ